MPHHYPLQTWYLSFGLIGFAEATTLGLGFRLFLENANEAFECSWYLFDTLEPLIANSMKPEIEESWIVVKWKHPPWTLPSEPIPPQQHYMHFHSSLIQLDSSSLCSFIFHSFYDFDSFSLAQQETTQSGKHGGTLAPMACHLAVLDSSQLSSFGFSTGILLHLPTTQRIFLRKEGGNGNKVMRWYDMIWHLLKSHVLLGMFRQEDSLALRCIDWVMRSLTASISCFVSFMKWQKHKIFPSHMEEEPG